MTKRKEHARVGIYEDRDELVDLLDRRFRKAGHIIVGVVRSMEDVERRTYSFIEHGMQYAVVDGNLTPGESEGTEGTLIVEGIKAINREIVTIGFSVNGKVAGADYNINKTGDGAFSEVARLITELHSWHR